MRNWSENQVTLIMIRHGATKANKEHRYLGSSNESLTQDGIKELFDYRKLNRYPKVDYLFTSPMKRCVETAAIIYPEREPVIVKDWVEMNFGLFEGKNYIDLKDDRRYQDWIDSNGTLPFPEGESREDFCNRCAQGFNKMTEWLIKRIEASQREQNTVGITVHGGTIMALISRYYGGEYFDYQVPNGGGYSCTLRGWGHDLKITELIKI